MDDSIGSWDVGCGNWHFWLPKEDLPILSKRDLHVSQQPSVQPHPLRERGEVVDILGNVEKNEVVQWLSIEPVETLDQFHWKVPECRVGRSKYCVWGVGCLEKSLQVENFKGHVEGREI